MENRVIPSLSKDSGITIIARGVVLLLAVATSIIISRVLGPSLNGSYRIILLVINVASLLVLFGLGAANVYYGARNPEQLPTLVGNSLAAALGLGLIGVAGIEIATFIPGFQVYLADNGVDARWIRWIAWLLPLVQMRAYLVEILRGKGDIVRYNLASVWYFFAGLAGVVILVWATNQGLEGAVIAWVIALIAGVILTTWLAVKAAGSRPKLDWLNFRRSFSFGSRLYLGNIAQFLNYRLDVFFVGFYLDPAAVGFYVTATYLGEILWELPHALRTVLLYQVATNEGETAVTMTAQLSRIISVVIGGICLLIAIASYPLIGILYGAAYLPAAPALIALMPGIWILSVGKLIASHLTGIGRPGVTTLGALLSLVCTVLLDILLIPRSGIVGAAIASSTAYLLSTLFMLYFFLQVTGLRWVDVFIIRREDMAVLRRVILRYYRQQFSKQMTQGEG